MSTAVPSTEDSLGDFSDKFDLAIFAPWSEDGKHKHKARVEEMVRRIKVSGLETFTYLSGQKDELIILLRAPAKLLRKFGDDIDFACRLDPLECQRSCEAGDAAANIKPFSINPGPEFCKYEPYEYIYGKYEQSANQKLYMRCGENNEIFSPTARTKLTYYLLSASTGAGGCGLNFTKMIAKNQVLSIFPLHDQQKLRDFKQSWYQWSVMPWNQPIDDIKDYFGEKMGLYFAFMSHYTIWLSLPALIGVIFQIIVFSTNNFSHPVLPFFSVIISVWSVLMLEAWKRNEKTISLKWGTAGFEDEEQDRPQFKGQTITSFINGGKLHFFPPGERQSLVVQSIVLICIMIMLVMGCVASIYVLRFYLYSSIGANASIVASVLNAVQITILNICYGKVAIALTKRENHRTDTEYEDSLIAKIFVFQFVNSYTSFYYLAFIAPYLSRPVDLEDDGVEGGFIGECGFDDCMKPLAVNLGIIFASALFVNNAIEVGLPILQNYLKKRAESKGVETEPTVPELQYNLLAYEVMTNNLQDYAEIAVQFGYMTIFIVALPASCMVSLINNFVEMKVDGWKMCNVYQRPIPRSAEDIGNWQAVLSIVSVVAIITNAGLICFTMDVFPDEWTLSRRIWVFVIFQWVMIAVQQLIAYIIPDEPKDFVIQRERTAFIVDKLIDLVPDEADDDDEIDDGDGETNYSSYDIDIQAYPLQHEGYAQVQQENPEKKEVELVNIDVTI
jgi:hypothetical protein